MKKFFKNILSEVSRLNFTVKKSFGLSDGGYYHIPLLFLGFGSNGFGIIVLGIYFGISWKR